MELANLVMMIHRVLLSDRIVKQALSMGDTDYFAVFCTTEQHRWLEAQTHGTALDAARLADLLLGSTADGRSLAAETFGCMQPFCQVLNRFL